MAERRKEKSIEKREMRYWNVVIMALLLGYYGVMWSCDEKANGMKEWWALVVMLVLVFNLGFGIWLGGMLKLPPNCSENHRVTNAQEL